jgi:hypothetical protein
MENGQTVLTNGMRKFMTVNSHEVFFCIAIVKCKWENKIKNLSSELGSRTVVIS